MVDLGLTPLANSMIAATEADRSEIFYPLHARVCNSCLLVQIQDVEAPSEIFREYTYFSSYSVSWLDHSRRFAETMVGRLNLTSRSKVIEVASNDGYLLQYFKGQGIPVLGIEPALNVAKVAVDKGIPTRTTFFGRSAAQELVKEGLTADLMIANNVLAHVPDLNDFVAGFKILLAPQGVLTVEFPSVQHLIAKSEFDTIYHEHFSYFCLGTAQHVFEAHGLAVFDVERLATHGGSLRVFVTHSGARPVSAAVGRVRSEERLAGLDNLETYRNFADEAPRAKADLLAFFLDARRAGKSVAGYGAPAKGNTLLNYCGIGPEFLPFTVDRSPHKQGRLLPGTRIPVCHPDAVHNAKPDYLLILPWNLEQEIAGQMDYIRAWGGQFVTPIPRVKVF